MIIVREGEARDIAGIMPVMKNAFDPAYGEGWTAAQCLSLLAFPRSQLLLATRDSDVVGFALTRWVLDEEELLMIGVDPAWQRSAVGKSLLGYILEKAKKEGRRRIFLEVRDSNPARLFYDAHGFTVCGHRKAYYVGHNGARYDATTMAIAL